MQVWKNHQHLHDPVGWLAEVLAGSNKHNAAFEWYILHTLHRAHRKEKQMAAKKKSEVYKSKPAMKKHEKGEGKKVEKKESKMGMKDVVKPMAKKKIAKSI